jgi:hypothetical protein
MSHRRCHAVRHSPRSPESGEWVFDLVRWVGLSGLEPLTFCLIRASRPVRFMRASPGLPHLERHEASRGLALVHTVCETRESRSPPAFRLLPYDCCLCEIKGGGEMAGFGEVLEQYHRTLAAFIQGDPEPTLRPWSKCDDVTLTNPFGPPVRG